GMRVRAALRLSHADLRSARAALRLRPGPRRALLSLRRARARPAACHGAGAANRRSLMTSNGALLEVKDLFKYFPIYAGLTSRHVADVRAVDGVSFTIEEGETLGLVGESGSGKTTIGRLLLRLLPVTKGQIRFQDQDVLAMNRGEVRRLRRSMQVIFQDPFASLNPRMSIGDIIAEPLEIHGITKGKETERRVRELLELVGLQPYH